MLRTSTTIAIAGASGFVGQRLVDSLRARAQVVALSRRKRSSEPGLSWRSCDLYSLKDCEQALTGCDIAIYLVHSMSLPSRLTQASFSDLDLILADNFARAAHTQGVRHIIYLSGLIERSQSSRSDKRSAHLESRYEVEQSLAAWGTPVTTLRAGLVVGPSGSSLAILTRLVSRLRVMVLPRWTQSMTQPIALADVLRAINLVLDDPKRFEGPYDIGGPDIMSYRDMIKRTAKAMGLRRTLIPVRIFTPRLSSLWVSLITGCSRKLVSPLVQSLSHNMVAQPNPLQAQILQKAQPFETALKAALSEQTRPKAAALKPVPLKSARSVQRLVLPPQRRAHWVAQEYLDWLDRSPFGFIRTKRTDQHIAFFLLGGRTSLLELRFAPERSCEDRALFYVEGGALVDPNAPRPCRLEFRESRVGPYVLAAIHDFYPRLPWYVYRYTQAIAHLLVMTLFGRHLRKVAQTPALAASA